MKVILLHLVLLSLLCISAVVQATTQPLLIVGDSNFPPYEFINEKGEPDGFVVELTREIMKDLNIPYTIKLHHFTHSLELMKKQKADLLTGFLYSDERHSIFDFSNMHSAFYLSLVCHKSSSIRTLSQLDSQTLILQNREIVRDLLNQRQINCKRIHYENMMEGLKVLNANPHMVAICESCTAKEIINKNHYDQLETRALAFYPQKYCFAAIKDKNPELITQINNSLLKLQANGTYSKLYDKWMTVHIEPSYSKFYCMLAAGVIIMIVLALFIMILKRKIHKALRKNNEWTKALEVTQRYLDLAIESGNIAVWGYDVARDRLFNISGQVFVEEYTPLAEAITLIHPEDAEEFGRLFTRLMKGESHKENICLRFLNPFTNEYEYTRKELTTILSPSRAVETIIGTHRNVTGEVLRNQEIEKYISSLKTAIKSSHLIQWDYDTTTQDLGIIYHEGNKLDYKGAYGYVLDNIVEEDKSMAIATIELMNQNTDQDIELAIRIDIKHSGKRKYYTINGSPVRGYNGKITGYSGFVRDTTSWQELNNMLISLNEKLQLALKAGHIIPITWDLNTQNICISSIEIKREYPIFDPNIDGLSYDDIVQNLHPGDYAKHKEVLDQLQSGQISRANFEARYDRDKTFDNFFDIHLVVSKLTPQGVPTQIVGYLQDITERKQIGIELQRAKDRAEQSNKLKSAFLANMSHEIRTPLNAIVGFSDLLMEAEEKEMREEYCEIIRANNELLLHLIEDILDLSKIESGHIELNPILFDLASSFNTITASLEQCIANPKVELIVSSPYSKCLVCLDEVRTMQVIVNFVTNAIKFTQEGHIEVGYQYIESGIRFYCKDTGIGIAPSKIEHVFDRFFKCDEFAQGSGLGMPISKAIAEAQHGTIGVESTIGQDTTFWMWVPCEAQIEKCDPVEIDAPESLCTDTKIPASSITLNSDHLQSIRILIAEDNNSNYLLMQAILREFTLNRAINGVEAVDMAAKNHYDLILMDIKMPIMDGLEATRAIRVYDTSIPIVAVTANAFDSDKEQAIAAGCNDFLSKPINKNELMDIISNLNR